MGQYYMVTILRNGKAKYYSRDVKPDKKGLEHLAEWEREQVQGKGYYYTMAKLMEHSYVDNQFVDAITEELIKNGSAQIAWVGDYADLPKEYKKYNPWKRNGRIIKYTTPAAEHVLSGKYIVNLTKRQYINFDEYYKANQWKETWTDSDGNKHESIWCIHPLPILTACGNGLGGGDYRGSCMGIVGAWAFDEIKIVDRKPSSRYHQVNPTFVER